MKNVRIVWSLLVVAFIGLMGFNEPAFAYTFTTIDYPGATDAKCWGINDAGQIVGAYDDAGGASHGFLRNEFGVFAGIDYPGATDIWCNGINNAGQIVGEYDDAGGARHGFLLDEFGFTSIDYPGATLTECNGINGAGQIVGRYKDAGGVGHGFLRDAGGVFTSIDYPGATSTDCYGINDAGDIVGDYEDAGGAEHGFLRGASGGFTSIDYPGATWTGCSGINDAGQIVGWYIGDFAIGFKFQGFLLDWFGGFTSIDYPGLTLTLCSGINDAGQIVGVYIDIDAGFAFHGFVTRQCPDDIIYPTGCISGTVTKDGTGVPLAGRLVKLERIYPKGPRRTVRTDYNGYYQFTDLEDGTYRLRVIRVRKAECRGERRKIIAVAGGGMEVYNVNFKCR